eukprot:358028-Chlamydomonas_euryale.AAC.1
MDVSESQAGLHRVAGSGAGLQAVAAGLATMVGCEQSRADGFSRRVALTQGRVACDFSQERT